MAQLTTKEYDDLERAVRDGRKIAVIRRGTEYVVVPQAVTNRGGKEAIETIHPTTGDFMVIFIDEISGFSVVR